MRQHIEHIAAALGALAFALFISYFNTGAVIHVMPVNQASGTLTPVANDTSSLATSTLPNFIISTSTFEQLLQGHSAASTPTSPVATTSVAVAPAKPAPPVVPKPAPTPKPTPTPVVTPAATSTPATSTPTTTGNSVLSTLKDSIVNIICVAHDGSLHSISGSGVIIDSRGIILTVAHVAQSDLLQEYLGTDKVSCVIRTGSPARTAYIAKPIYVSDAWVKKNATTLISSSPTGTGENDYALLAITAGANGKPLPSAFPAVPLSSSAVHIGDAVDIGSYGAQDLSSAQINTALYPTLVMSTVKDRYTFGSNTVDVLSINGSAASQEGSSGGAVTNEDGKLVGIITTSEITGPISSRDMRVITPSYIRRSYEEATGKDFDSYFGDTSLTTLENVYAPTAQTLGQFIAHAIGLD